MPRFAKLVTSALAVLASATLPASAITADEFKSHEALWAAVQSAGVRTYINPAQCYTGSTRGVDGFYISSAGVLVVCQDNAKGEAQVPWTANDLDTLRHEAVHLIQDCIDGRGDQSLVPIVGSDEERNRLALSVLGSERAMRIITAYRLRGANAHTIRLELEAFSFAQEIPASAIAQQVISACGVR